MADERVRIEIGFVGGQTISATSPTPDAFEASARHSATRTA